MDVAILEVGLGGRLDATNIVPQPVVCGVSSLGFDHMELLGHTLTVSISNMQSSTFLLSLEGSRAKAALYRPAITLKAQVQGVGNSIHSSFTTGLALICLASTAVATV